MVLVFYQGKEYLRTLTANGTTAPTNYYLLSAPSTPLSGASKVPYTQEGGDISFIISGENYIFDNLGNKYYLKYADVYEVDAGGLVGTHPIGKRP